MIGRTNTGGGGGGKAFAVIHVDYPAGSICTCTNGTKTLKAKDTSGVWNFLVPESGNWTVASHTTGKDKSQTVAISSQGQAVNVVLTYELVVYNRGDENISATGGLTTSNSGGAVVTKEATDIKIYLYSELNWGTSASVLTVNNIPLSSYTQIKVRAKVAIDNGHSFYITVRNGNQEVASKQLTASSSETEYTLSISEVSSDCAVGIRGGGTKSSGGGSISSTAYIYSITLE